VSREERLQEQEQLRWEGTVGMSQEEEPETRQHNRCAGYLGSVAGHRKKVTLPSLSSVGIRGRKKRDWRCLGL